MLSLTLSIVLGGTSLSACAPAADNGKVHALASFYPLQFLLERIGGELVTVESLTPPGAEPHDLELAPVQLRAVGSADLVAYLAGFQPSVDEAVRSRTPAQVVEASAALDLDAKGIARSKAEAAEAGAGTARTDPHFWLDPTLMADLVAPLAAALATADPTNKATYEKNGDALVADLKSLDADYRSELATCERDVVVVAHEAFGYLTSRYGLTQVGVSGLDPDAEPSPARVREIRKVVEAHKVTTIFTEQLLSPKASEILASDLGITTAVLDPVEAKASAHADYLEVMKQNLVALRTALGCA